MSCTCDDWRRVRAPELFVEYKLQLQIGDLQWCTTPYFTTLYDAQGESDSDYRGLVKERCPSQLKYPLSSPRVRLYMCMCMHMLCKHLDDLFGLYYKLKHQLEQLN